MTTHADFYDGRGPQAVWLGSLQGDADPATVFATPPGRLALTATDPITYADAVTDLLDVWADEDLGHGYHPADGWPWPWPESGHTDWIYAFDHGRVWITTGHPTTRPRPPNPTAPTACPHEVTVMATPHNPRTGHRRAGDLLPVRPDHRSRS